MLNPVRFQLEISGGLVWWHDTHNEFRDASYIDILVFHDTHDYLTDLKLHRTKYISSKISPSGAWTHNHRIITLMLC